MKIKLLLFITASICLFGCVKVNIENESKDKTQTQRCLETGTINFLEVYKEFPSVSGDAFRAEISFQNYTMFYVVDKPYKINETFCKNFTLKIRILYTNIVTGIGKPIYVYDFTYYDNKYRKYMYGNIISDVDFEFKVDKEYNF